MDFLIIYAQIKYLVMLYKQSPRPWKMSSSVQPSEAYPRILTKGRGSICMHCMERQLDACEPRLIHGPKRFSCITFGNIIPVDVERLLWTAMTVIAAPANAPATDAVATVQEPTVCGLPPSGKAVI